MSASDSSSQFQEFYEEVLRKSGIDYTKIEVKAPPFQGENFGSVVNFITVDQGTLELFAKRALQNSGYATHIEKLQLFTKESSFFNIILPLLQDLIRERAGNDYKLDMIPKCYFASEEAVVLENLAKRDYIQLDKKDRQTLGQATLVIKALAKYHASSYVLLSEKIKPDELVEQYPFFEEQLFSENPETDFLSQFMEPSLNMQSLILSAYEHPDAEYAANVIKGFQGKLTSRLPKYFKLKPSTGRNVILHGDLWNNNQLFHKNPSSGELDHVVLVDYQVLRVGTPALDLAHYMFASIQSDVRRENWETLLKLYFDELTKNVQALKGALSFTFEDLVQDFKDNFQPGFLIGSATLFGFEAMEDLGDVNLETMVDPLTTMMNAGLSWIKKHPDRAKAAAKGLSEFYDEYKFFTTSS